MLIMNPDEGEKESCTRSFTLKSKHQMIAKIESCCALNALLDEACRKFSLKTQYYHQWKMELDHVPNSSSSNMRKIHSGHPGLLMPLNDVLLKEYV